jgi:hypothetical protein
MPRQSAATARVTIKMPYEWLSAGVELLLTIKQNQVEVLDNLGLTRNPGQGAAAADSDAVARAPQDSNGSATALELLQVSTKSNTVTGLRASRPRRLPQRKLEVLVHFNLFRNLNWTSRFRVKRALTKEEYKAIPFVSFESYTRWRESFQDCGLSAFATEQERKLHLAMLWRNFRKDSLMWTASKGRVESWSEFKKRNGKYLRSKFLKPSAIWAQYQETWMCLIGFHRDNSEHNIA